MEKTCGGRSKLGVDSVEGLGKLIQEAEDQAHAYQARRLLLECCELSAYMVEAVKAANGDADRGAVAFAVNEAAAVASFVLSDVLGMKRARNNIDAALDGIYGEVRAALQRLDESIPVAEE